MMSTVIEYAASFIEAIIASNFLVGYNGVKNGKNKYFPFTVITVLLFSSTCLFNHFTYFESVYGAAYVIILFGCSMILLGGKIYEKIFSSVVSIAMIAVINMVILTIFSSAFDSSISELIEGRNVVRIMVLFFTKFLYFLLCQFILVTKRKINNYLNSLEWLMIIITFSISMFVSLIILSFAYRFQLSSRDYSLMYAATGGIIVINLVTFYLFIVLNKHHKQMLQLNGMKIHMKQREQSLDELKSLSLEMRKIKHDMSKFVDITSHLILEKNYSKALEYLSELQDNVINEKYQTITTSNDIVNAILNAKRSYCMANNIDFIYRITADLSHYSDLDVSMLLGNLLDNAIEGTKGCADPYIKISISENKAYLMILVTNSIQKSVLINNPELKTTKSNSDDHGLGLLTIRDIVNKYDGLLGFAENDGAFTADVRLKSTYRNSQ